MLGLGNPGLRFINTRHNAGFQFLDVMAKKLGLSFKKPFLKKWEAAATEDFILIKPLTYMNRSGDILADLFKRYSCGPENLLVLVDQMDLPEGRARLKMKGSGGSHNGMRSINACLGMTSYKRLYLGVGAPDDDIVEHVLGDFTNIELETMDRVYNKISEIILQKKDNFSEIQNTINSINES